ncbi:PRA1 family protein E isoform X2 [Jatropha curcas]|uniref:PRA1 family protein E isoform X2 n=1 Tax=Jatropha curcas TaxID=180498 RepID=UPI001895BEBB|nr:PRA1 family protein E isoform X2 [Jatropha curcas]
MSLKSSAGYGTIPSTTTTTTQPPTTTATSLTFISRATTATQTIMATRRPWRELLNLSSLSRPYSYGEAISRIKYNLNYFRDEVANQAADLVLLGIKPC